MGIDSGKAKVNAGQETLSPVVHQRLRTLLELAVAIGRREGLLGNRPGTNCEAVGGNGTGIVEERRDVRGRGE